MLSRYKALVLLLWMATLDAVSLWLLIFFYLTGVDIMFLVNINFVCMSLVLMMFAFCDLKLNSLSLLFASIFVVSMLKLVGAFYYGNPLGIKHLASYYLSILMPLAALSFTNGFETGCRERLDNIMIKFSRRYVLISFPGIIIYAILYFAGNISYFGMGANLHYVYPFFLPGVKSSLLFLVLIIASGKRAVLMNFMAQVSMYYFSYMVKRPITMMFIFFLVSIGLVYLYENTSLFYRFDVFLEMDTTDPRFLMLAFSGRFEELVGIYNYFMNNPLDFWLGAPPGAHFDWVVENNLVMTKNTSHVTFFGYVFRYGIIAASALYIMLIYYLVRFWSPKSPYYLVYLGVVTSSFFGANMMIDPTAWIMIGLMLAVHRSSRHKLEYPMTQRLSY